MASDLVMRLCQVDERYGGLPGAGKSPGEPGYDPATTNIATDPFVSGLQDIHGGYHTLTNMKTFYDMPVGQQASLDVLIGKINSATTDAKKSGRIDRFRSILFKWAVREDLNLSGYDTPDDIETQLLAIDTGFL